MYNDTLYLSQNDCPLLIKPLLKNDDFNINNLCDIQNIIFDEKIVNKTIDTSTLTVLSLIKDNIEHFGYPKGSY